VSQVAGFTDAKLERDYVFCRARSSYLRDSDTVERLDLGAEVELTHLRHQMTFTGSLTLESEVGEVKSLYGEGKGGQQELDLEHLSSIVEVLNERFGTDLTNVDKLLLDQFEESRIADSELADQAQNYSLANFRLVFDKKFLQPIVTRVDANEKSSKRILDDEDFRTTLGEFYLRKVYERLKDPASLGNPARRTAREPSSIELVLCE
jgi:type I restriction enzyme R subunit